MATLPKSAPEPEAPETLETPETPEPAPNRPWRWFGKVVRLIIILAALGISGYISYQWLSDPPVAQRRPREREAVLVEVTPVGAQTAPVIVSNNGVVIPAREIRLAARVSGQIIDISPHFTPGGRFAQNDMILRIDQEDYALAVEQQRAHLVRAQSDLRLEMGQQSVAQLEYELLGELAPDEDTSLVLREPQLESRKAAIATAQAALDKAQLDLARTTITAPFNAVIHDRLADLGAYVTPGTSLATLVGSDEYWIEVAVPVDELRWLQIPGMNSETGSEARVYHAPSWGPGAYREGHVQRIMTGLEAGSRMARLLVVVEDPLQLHEGGKGERPLILGAFVRVEIIGQEVPDVFKVPSQAMRDGGYLWVMTEDNTLDIRQAEVVWSSNNHVYVSAGLEDGEQLVVSDLAGPVAGMLLRTEADEPAAPRGEGSGQGHGRGQGHGQGRGGGGMR